MSRKPVARADRPPDHLPEHVLARDDFAEACACGDLGKALKIAKQYGGVGFTASHLARRCELTDSRVREYISGRRQVTSLEVVNRIADGLHIPGEMLNVAPRPWEDRIVEKKSAKAANFVASPHSRETEDEDLDRRTFGLTLTGFVASIGFSASTSDRPVRIGQSELGQLSKSLRELWSGDHVLGGGGLVQEGFRQYRRARQMLNDGLYDEQTTQQLMHLTGELAVCAGWLCYDAGFLEPAERLYREGLFIAQQADDEEVTVRALEKLAMQSSRKAKTEGNPGYARESVRLVSRATDLARRLPPDRLHTLLAVREARGYALLGDERGANHAIARSKRELERDFDTREVEPWLPAEVLFQEAVARCELGDFTRAETLFRSSAQQTPSRRNAALYRAELASVLAARGDRRAAIEEASAAIVTLDNGTSSARTLNTLQSIIPILHGFPEEQSLKGEIERLQVMGVAND